MITSKTQPNAPLSATQRQSAFKHNRRKYRLLFQK